MMLALETSGTRASVALAWEDGRVREAAAGGALCHARDVLVLADGLLREEGRAPGDLGSVAAGLGPGSYTGMRVGAATAKLLAWALGVPLVGVGSLAVLAENAPPEHEVVVSAIAAKRGCLFCGVYRRRDGRLAGQERPRFVEIAEAVETIPSGAAVLGSGTPMLVEATKGKGIVALGEELWEPRAAALAQIALEKLRAGETTSPPALAPLYLRRSEAEELWEKRHGDVGGGGGLSDRPKRL
ncbi:MAG: tRNA (adenosine(37)-N6)-threonylcarbamoyltransferase complex dimerization subunit type 1 TsaB [Planctomycetota bacterium]